MLLKMQTVYDFIVSKIAILAGDVFACRVLTAIT